MTIIYYWKLENLPETWHNPKIQINRKFSLSENLITQMKISEFCQKIDKTNIKFKQPKNSLLCKMQ